MANDLTRGTGASERLQGVVTPGQQNEGLGEAVPTGQQSGGFDGAVPAGQRGGEPVPRGGGPVSRAGEPVPGAGEPVSRAGAVAPAAPAGAPAGAPALDPGLLQVIRSSAGRLIQFEDAFAQHLQFDMLPLIPDLAAEGRTFCERMVHSVLWVAVTDQPPQVIIDTLRWVGARNWIEGFPDAGYPSLATALVRAVRELSGNDWSTSMGSAWISYFLWMRPHLLLGAQQAATQQTAPQAGARPAGGSGGRQSTVPSKGAQDPSAQARGGQPQDAAGDVELEAVANLLGAEDDEDEDGGYGQIMVSMTRNSRRDRPRRQD
ncbi:MAG: hypothetical protein JOY82_03890 [Streptosporangiaceae bacterium]|nr:hypothetical protein [Streptosporangiaceae bacterium]MBV9853653.1 hypothetical protein [Streptosporangiaceae bacterium]